MTENRESKSSKAGCQSYLDVEGEAFSVLADCEVTGKGIGFIGDCAEWGQVANSILFHEEISKQICSECSSKSRMMIAKYFRESESEL